MIAGVYLVALAVLAVFGVHRLALTLRAARARRGEPAAAAAPAPPGDDACPVVTVQLPLWNEAAVAGRLLDAVGALDWPRARLEVQVLDDSTDETAAICAAGVARLRAAGIDAHHLRRAERAGFKAGALEAGRRVARGELLLVLDADFVPPPDLLRRAAPPLADPSVAMVQARWEHLDADASALTRAQALLLDGHFGVEQAARAAAGRIFNFNGTAGVWRAAAIADAGGWQADTLTEDLDLSYRAALRGWRFVYLRDLAAPAELPATMAAFKSQQFRWAKGAVECARKLLPAVARSRLPWRSRLEGALHLTQNAAYPALLVAMLAAAPVLVTGAVPAWLHGTTAALAALSLGAYAWVSARGAARGVGGAVRAVARVPLLGAVTAGIALHQTRAVLEGALGRRSPFVRTPKDGGARRARRYRVARGRGWLAELALAVYLAVVATLAVARGEPAAAVMLAVFAIGCGWVAIATALDA